MINFKFLKVVMGYDAKEMVTKRLSIDICLYETGFLSVNFYDESKVLKYVY